MESDNFVSESSDTEIPPWDENLPVRDRGRCCYAGSPHAPQV
jgi:hypothetical protein